MRKIVSIALSASVIFSAAALPARADESAAEKITYNYSYDTNKGYTADGAHTRQMEKLDRGLTAIQSSGGVYLSWRLLDSEDAVYGSAEKNTEFNVYRDGVKIAAVTDSTNYTDTTAGKSYTVAPVINGKEGAKCKAVSVNSGNYFDIPLDKPESVTLADGVTYEYTANDASCGDLDGDGEYEIILKWDCNGKDNSHDGYTGNVYLDAYKMNGRKLWRIDLGQNIRAGAHYTQFLVYDFDGDGKSEITCQTALGSKGGDGKYVTSSSHVDAISAVSDETNKNTNNTGTNGKILTGDEYLTIFDGLTGKAEDTIYYPNQRVAVKTWGDKDEGYGNRSDRFTAAVAYLDGVKPYAVYMRGYYMRQNGGNSERQAACAVSFDGKSLDCKYSFDTYDVNNYRYKSSSSSYDGNGNYKGVDGYRAGNEKYVGQGNHNCTVADVDNNGTDEVMTGALCYELKDNILQPRWCTFKEHGDALHISDYDPTHKGLEFFTVHEDGNGISSDDSDETKAQKIAGPDGIAGTDDDYGYIQSNAKKAGKDVICNFGMSVIDADTGEILFHEGASADTGRGIMANVGAGGYYQIWSAKNAVYYTSDSKDFQAHSTLTGRSKPSMNFRIFWDGDLYDELLDGTTITSYNGRNMGNIFSANGCTSVNGTKANPALQADLFGDWREEVVYPTSDNTALRVFSTTTPTDYKIKTLMHDPVYRSGVAAEQTAYNQPPHVGFYMDEETLKGGVTELNLITPPSKTTYKIGEELNLSGCELTAVYANGSTEAISIDNCKISGYNSYESGEQTVTVTYKEHSVSFKAMVLSSFEFDAQSALITGFDGTDETIVIPEYIDGIAVKGIDNNAFADKPLKDIYIYNDITIGLNVFPEGITIHCFEGSSVSDYAVHNNINVEYITPRKVYADVTFEESEYNEYSAGNAIADFTANSIYPLTFKPGLRNASETSEPFYKQTTSDGNSYLDVVAKRFASKNRHGSVTLDDIPNLSDVTEYQLSMDFYIQSNTKGLKILISDEDAQEITSFSADTDGLSPDTWYQYTLTYDNGSYSQTISKDDTPVISEKLDYSGKKSVKTISFPVQAEVNTDNHIYLDNISLTSPLICALTVDVTDSSGTPAVNAEITLGDITAVTNANGQAVVNLPAGLYTLTASHEYLTDFEQSNFTVYSATQVKNITMEGTLPTQDFKIESVNGNSVTVNTPELGNVVIYAAKYNGGALEEVDKLIPERQYRNTFNLTFEADKVFMWTNNMSPLDCWTK